MFIVFVVENGPRFALDCHSNTLMTLLQILVQSAYFCMTQWSDQRKAKEQILWGWWVGETKDRGGISMTKSCEQEKEGGCVCLRDETLAKDNSRRVWRLSGLSLLLITTWVIGCHSRYWERDVRNSRWGVSLVPDDELDAFSWARGWKWDSLQGLRNVQSGLGSETTDIEIDIDNSGWLNLPLSHTR